jgi:hypothetical protein
MIPIENREQLEAIVEAVGAVKAEFDRRFGGLKPDQAAFVRQLRVDRGLSWRGVAWECAKAWGGDWESNQLAGIALCERAAAMHDEDPNTDPWN